MTLQNTRKTNYLKWLVILLFFSTAHSAVSQNLASISGTIMEKTSKEPVVNASVKLLQEKDSVFVKGIVSDKKGKFSIYAEKGNYILEVSFVGFKTIYRNVSLSQKEQSIKLGTLFLEEDLILLDAAIVEAKAPEIIVRGDTIEYNADSYKVSEHAVVEDLLRKIPGINVSADGKITVNGKEIRKIYVDGKEFFSDDPEMMTKNLPAKIIHKVQVYEHKSEHEKMTGFKESGENDKVLNFTVKEEMRKGWLGNMALGYGSKNRYEAQTMINRMQGDDRYTFIGRANNIGSQMPMEGSFFFGDMNGGLEKIWSGGLNLNKSFSEKMDVSGYISSDKNDREHIQKSKIEHIIAQGNTIKKDESNSISNMLRNAGNARFNWQPDSLTTILGNTNLSLANSQNTNASTYHTLEANGDTIHRGNSSNTNTGDNYTFTGSISASRKFSKKGRSITASLQASANQGTSSGSNHSTIYFNKQQRTEVLDQKNTGSNNSAYFNGQLSYVEPIGKDKFVSFSYSFNTNTSESDKDARNKDGDGNYTLLDKRYTRSFLSNSKSHNLMLSFRSSGEKIDYQLGFRLNPSFNENKSYMKDSLLDTQKQNITEYSPDAHFSYIFSERERVSLRYSGRSNHPSARQLSSVAETTNPLYVTYGNPNLKAAFNNNISIDYNNYNSEKQSALLFSASFSNTLNQIAVSNFIDKETGRQETTYENINGNWNAGLSAILHIPLKNIKYSLSSNTNLNYGHSKNFINKALNTSKNLSINENLNFDYSSDYIDYAVNGSLWYNNVKNALEGQQNTEFMNWQLSGLATWRLPKDFMLNTDISYVGNKGYSSGFSQNEILWNASVSKDFLKGKKGKISLTVYDILRQKTTIFHEVTNYSIEERTSNALTSFFILRFTYRFNIFNKKA